jgi:hypothetical protein
MTNPTRGGRKEIWPVGILFFFAALYYVSFFNRFAGLRSGDGEFSGGMALLAGRLPYRDYFTAGPPLNQLKSAIELALFGKALIVTRICAVLERLVIAGVLYAWLRRSFGAWASSLAALVTIIVSTGDLTDPLASYNHDAILSAMLCGFGASVSLESQRPRNRMMLALFAGLAAGFSALTKQTVGLGTAVAVLVIGGVACARIFGFRRCAEWIAAYVVGFAVPVVLVGVYLAHLGVLHACLQMLFVTGPAAKASSPGMFVWREILIASVKAVWVLQAVIAILLCRRAIWRSFNAVDTEAEPSPSQWRWLAVVSLLTIGAAELLALTSLHASGNSSTDAIYFAFIGTGIFGFLAVVSGLRRPGSSSLRMWQIAVFAAVGWSVAFTLSLSWPAFEAMTLPGLGLLLAAGVEGARQSGRRFIYAAIAVMVFLAVRKKLDQPFAFDGLDEPPVRFSTVKSDLPALRGMRLSAETARLLDETVPLMHSASVAHQPVFTYPEMGLFYALSGGNPPTWSGSHNIDVVSDTLAQQDAERLLRNPPEVILYERVSEATLHIDELVWRDGRPSGQRALIAALDTLSANYQLVDTFRLLPRDPPIQLYIRKAKFARGAAPGNGGH